MKIAFSILLVFFGVLIGFILSESLGPRKNHVILEPLKGRNTVFFEKIKIESPELADSLAMYIGFTVAENKDLIYNLRDEKFKQSFSKKLNKQSGPLRQQFEGIYFDVNDYEISETIARFGVTYFKRPDVSDESFEKFDEYWIYDKVTSKWNLLSSPISGVDLFGREPDASGKTSRRIQKK